MNGIHVFDLERVALSGRSRLTSTQRGIQISDGFDSGEILSLPWKALLVRWMGLSIEPDDWQIGIALRDPSSEHYYSFVADVWIEQSEPIYQTPEVVRRGLPFWKKEALQFRLQLNRDANGRSPQVRSIRVGYTLDLADVSTYLLQYAFPAWFSRSVQLLRQVTLKAGQSQLPLLNGIVVERMSDIRFDSYPIRGRYECTVQEASGRRFVSVSPPVVVATTGSVTFNYSLQVEGVGQSDAYQVDSIPCVVIRLLELANPMNLQSQGADWVQGYDHSALMVQVESCAHYVFQATVIAATDGEARSVARQLRSRIRQEGGVDLPPAGLRLPVQLVGRASEGLGSSGQELQVASLKSVNFQFQLPYLAEEGYSAQSSLITDSAIAISSTPLDLQ